MPGAEYRIRTISTGRGRVLLAAVVVLAAGGLHMAAAGAAPAPNAAFVRVNQGDGAHGAGRRQPRRLEQ